MSTDNKPQIPKIDETKPVVWTAEDASRFLTSAIHEAQKPLAEALKQRPITSKALTLIVAVLIVAALAIALILSNQLEKTEKRADAMQTAREEILSEKVNLQAQTSTLQDRLSAITNQHLDLQGQIDALRVNEEKHKRTQVDLSRFRRQNDLLRSQISGLEMEKVALSRQLDAVKALAEADPDEEYVDPFDSSDPASQNGSGPAAPAAAATDAQAPEKISPTVAPAAEPAAPASALEKSPETPAAPAVETPEASAPMPDKYSSSSHAGAIPRTLEQRADHVLREAEKIANREPSRYGADQAEEVKKDAEAIRADMADVEEQMRAQDDIARDAGLDPAELKAEADEAKAEGEAAARKMASESREDYKKDLDAQLQKVDEAEKAFESRFTEEQQQEIMDHAEKALADVHDIREKVDEAEASRALEPALQKEVDEQLEKADAVDTDSPAPYGEKQAEEIKDAANRIERDLQDIGENLKADDDAQEARGLDPAALTAETDKALEESRAAREQEASDSPEEAKKDMAAELERIEELDAESAGTSTEAEDKAVFEHADRILDDVKDIREEIKTETAIENADDDAHETAPAENAEAGENAESKTESTPAPDAGDDAAASEYVTLDPNATVPTMHADEAAAQE